ncbi:MAG: sugar phosphate isomerase/epimerase [Lentisphaeria bacterium]|nr:sugar phosphate isomerase/epimerase [Lentisphaeria bacterium]
MAQAGFRYALNTSTIRGYELPIERQIEVTAQAGYDGIEPWLRDVDAFLARGGRLPELRRRIEDAGLGVAGTIAFWKWADADPAVRAAALEQAAREMDTIAATGGTCAAAPPLGNVAKVSLDAFGEAYSALCEIGARAGVLPLLELWGHAPRLSTLAEVLYVAAASRRPEAGILLDIYHLYKGGNRFESLRLLSGSALRLFHVNDYPDTPPRDRIGDKHRVWPGDGVAPSGDIARTLREIGYTGYLSLELFNPEYWKGDALDTARTGLAKARTTFDAVP